MLEKTFNYYKQYQHDTHNLFIIGNFDDGVGIPLVIYDLKSHICWVRDLSLGLVMLSVLSNFVGPIICRNVCSKDLQYCVRFFVEEQMSGRC